MTIDELLDRLDRGRPSGPDTWQAACPAHEDRVASLSLAVGRDGRILVHCHAGCSTGEIVAALGLTIAALFAGTTTSSPRRRRSSSSAGVITIPGPGRERHEQLVLPRARPVAPPVLEDDVARWRDRLQAHDGLLARLVEVKGWRSWTLERLDVGWDGRRLTFPVRGPRGVLLAVQRYLPGGHPKMIATKGAPRELWPAPESLPASGPIVLVEGEPDAVSAIELGLLAVGIPGAATWRTEWASRLAGRTVIVVGDCDAPGRAAAARARGHLADVADVRLVDLDPHRGDGHDLGDELAHVAAHGALAVHRLRNRLLELAGVDQAAVRLSGRPEVTAIRSAHL